MGSLMDQIETALYAVAFVWQCALQILYYLLLYKYVKRVAQPKGAA